ncbi:hypothetical protein BDDG_07711 [Blastomyces dermatitidis ATCC 18188]|uniref:Uncharacterized protein n=1 Tax=Ajellomyces dermatitidis (strain ATCC 18188 / CBS 674.68) TaxID=653446 RepID=F2TNF3_AJEDA|nr:hypothetical protein BDDG_07711 [Blastomyces dermatitidis ATCC 18188]
MENPATRHPRRPRHLPAAGNIHPLRIRLRALQHLQNRPALLQSLPRPLDGRHNPSRPLHSQADHANPCRLRRRRREGMRGGSRPGLDDGVLAEMGRGQVRGGDGGGTAARGAGGGSVEYGPERPAACVGVDGGNE